MLFSLLAVIKTAAEGRALPAAWPLCFQTTFLFWINAFNLFYCIVTAAAAENEKHFPLRLFGSYQKERLS